MTVRNETEEICVCAGLSGLVLCLESTHKGGNTGEGSCA